MLVATGGGYFLGMALRPLQLPHLQRKGMETLSAAPDLRTIQLLLGHRSLQTTVIYTLVLDATRQVLSPLDRLGPH